MRRKYFTEEERKEPQRALARGYYAKHKEDISAQKKVYYAANREKISAKHKTYYLANPAQAHAGTSRYRARKANAPINDLTQEQWEEIKQYYGRCVYCPPDCKACKKKTHKLTQEHLTPLSKNGSHTVLNVVPACQSCNSRKNNRGMLNPVQPLLLTIAPPEPAKKGRKKQS